MPIFRGFHVGHDEGPPSHIDPWGYGGIDKGQLVTPPLSHQDTGLFDYLAERFIEWRGQLVWHSFLQIKRKEVRLAASAYPGGFWKKVIELAGTVGLDPVLLVPHNTIGSDVSKWTYSAPPEGLTFEYRQDQATGAGFGYEGTVNGVVDVYAIALDADQAWLLSARILRSIRYARLESGHLVDLSFLEGDDPHNSKFTASFAQNVEWNDMPVIELVLRSHVAKRAATDVQE